MRPFVLNILLYIIFSIFGYILIVIVWSSLVPIGLRPNIPYINIGYGHMYSRMQEVRITKDVDILFMGSSHAYRGFDIRLFSNIGYSSFNLGSSAQTPLQSEILFKRYLQNLNPKLIIFEVYPSPFTSDGVESSLELISKDKNDRETLKLIFKQNHLKLYNTMIYSGFLDLIGKKTFDEPARVDMDLYVSGGFVERDITHFKPKQYVAKTWEVKPNQLAAFKRCLEMANESRSKVVLIQAPVASCLYSSFTNNQEFDEIMHGFGTYYNFNYLMNLDDSLHFYDAHHLNQNGVELFNAKVLEVLKNDGHLPN
jgi:hypothetical protein